MINSVEDLKVGELYKVKGDAYSVLFIGDKYISLQDNEIVLILNIDVVLEFDNDEYPCVYEVYILYQNIVGSIQVFCNSMDDIKDIFEEVE